MIFAAALLCTPAVAQEVDFLQFITPDPRIWMGEISYKRSGISEVNEEESRGGKTGNRRRKREVEENMVVGACGEVGSLFVTEATRTLADIVEGSSFLQAASAECGSPRDIRHPGSSSRTTEKTTTTIHKWIGMPTEEELTTVYLALQPGNRYVLVVANSMLVTTTSDLTTTDWDACSGKERRTETHVKPGKVGQLPDFSMNATPDGRDSILRETRPPIPLEAGFSAKAEVEGDFITGNKLLGEIEPRGKEGYRERTTASWHFQAKDPCPEVYDALLWDLATAEAYGDEGLRRKAFEVDDYDIAVAQQAREIASSAPSGSFSGTSSPSPDIGTTMDCNLFKEEKHREDLAEQCKPSVIFRKDLAHERVHVSQCRKRHQEFVEGRNNPSVYGSLETEAYVRGVEVLLDWFEQNRKYCPAPPYDTSDFRRRVDRLKVP